MILSADPRLGPDVLDLPRASHSYVVEDAPLKQTGPASAVAQTLASLEREHIRRVLALTNRHLYGKGGAAELLGLKPSPLQSRMKKLSVKRKEEVRL